MNFLAWVLVIGLGILIVYEVVSLVRSILNKRKMKREQSLKDGVDVQHKEDEGR